MGIDINQDKKKKSRTGCLIAALIVGIIIIVILAIALTSTPSTNTSPTTYTPKTTSVRYEVTGTANAVDVTLSNPTGGTEQYNYYAVPFTKTYSVFPNYFLYISAQNQGEYGTVTVSIYVNGQLYKTATSAGAYAIATASGSK